MINAVIVDDEQKSIAILKRLIAETGKQVHVVNQAQSVEEGYQVIKAENPQLVFLDVEMLDGTGFNLLEKFDKINFEVIFTTAYDKYAIRAIRYSAIDYLLKPIDLDDLERAIDKVEKNRQKSLPDQELIDLLLSNMKKAPNEKRIAIKGASKIELITSNEIVFIEAESNYSELVLTDKKIVSTQTLKQFEQLFEDDTEFFRVSRGHIVNIKHIRIYHKNREEIELTTGNIIPVSRRRKKEFLDLLEHDFRNL
ncbi:MAG: response regulator [Flavobacteriales bacterium]|nr:response regulator [Flavobacteriales bacterium]